MTANFHTHSVFCDGKDTPEDIVIKAIEKGFSAIGFSGHGYTDFDLQYCMKDTDGYIATVSALKEKYKNDIEIYLGIEEDIFSEVDRGAFDYIIGSSHYIKANGKYLSIDSSIEDLKKCLEAFGNDPIRFANAYYENLCDYIKRRRPDIIGHFDLITKFDEMGYPLFLQNEEYNILAEKYIAEAAESGCIFELNTGAVSRGIRTGAYPAKNLLYVLKRCDAKMILSSDCHSKENLDFGFKEAKELLRHIGFRHLYTIRKGEFVKYDI